MKRKSESGAIGSGSRNGHVTETNLEVARNKRGAVRISCAGEYRCSPCGDGPDDDGKSAGMVVTGNGNAGSPFGPSTS